MCIKNIFGLEGVNVNVESFECQLKKFADIFGIKIVNFIEDGSIREYQPEYKGIFPILYLLKYSTNYYLLYTKSMIDIEIDDSIDLTEIVFESSFLCRNLTVYHKNSENHKNAIGNIIDPARFFLLKSNSPPKINLSSAHFKPSLKSNNSTEINCFSDTRFLHLNSTRSS